MIDQKDIKELITLINGQMSNIKTCFPCQVTAVNKDRVSVKLLVKDTVDFDYPEILDIPIFVLKAGISIINLPIAIGDKGLLFVSTKSTRQFKNSTDISYKTIYDIDNSFYFGGVLSNDDDNSDIVNNLRIKHGDDIVDLTNGSINIVSGNVNIGDAVSYVLNENASILDSFGGACSIVSAGQGKVKA